MGFNMGASDPSLVPAGTHLVEVSECKEKRSKKSGALMWEVSLRPLNHRGDPIQEWWMLEGKMEWAMRKRLALLGFAHDAIVEAHQILGLRFYAAIVHGEDMNGATVARIDGRAENSTVGMWSEMEPPANVQVEESQASNLFGEKDAPKKATDEETPF